MTRIAYLPGDGIGPEVLGVARRVLAAAGFQAEWRELPIGWTEWCRRGDPLPSATLEAVRTSDAALLGAITSKPEEEAQRELDPSLRGRALSYRSPIVRLRQELDLWNNLRPVRSLAGNPRNLSDRVDLVLFRENTEDLYTGLEARPVPPAILEAWRSAFPGARLPPTGQEAAWTVRSVTRAATERVVRAAFEYARAHGRRKVTLLEKSNVLRATGGLVRDVFQRVARGYDGVEAAELNVDAACALVVRTPDAFDVVVATNLFGDIFSDVAAEVAGGLPLAASANLGDRHAVFEPVHGSAPTIAGQGVANPLGAVLAGAMMARHVGQAGAAERVEDALSRLMADRRHLPVDLGGHAGTLEVEGALLDLLARGGARKEAPDRMRPVVGRAKDAR